MQPVLPKRKGFQLESHDQIHIIRAPPASIHLRKHEPVNMADIMYLSREDDSRLNEGIRYVSTNGNKMSNMNFTNNGNNGANLLHSNNNVQSRNPYAITTVRPPEFKLEDTEALSRRRRPDIAVSSNPGVRDGIQILNQMNNTDKAPIHNSIDKQKMNYLPINPIASLRRELPQQIFTDDHIIKRISTSAVANLRTLGNVQTINPDSMQAASRKFEIQPQTASVSNTRVNQQINQNRNINQNEYIKDQLLLQNISSGYTLTLYNPTTQKFNNVDVNIKDAQNIAVAASRSAPISLISQNGTNVKLRDYRAQVVDSGRRLVIHLPSNIPELELERNTPIYAVGTNINGLQQNQHYEKEHFVADRVVANNIFSNASTKHYNPDSTRLMPKLTRATNFGSSSSASALPTFTDHVIPQLYEKNITSNQLHDMSDRFQRR